MSEKQPAQIQRRGTEAMRDGRHEEALADFDWYWRFALAHQPSQSGVRLSFFLTEMQNLAEIYPPAAERMNQWREEARQALLGESADPSELSDYLALATRAGAIDELRETLSLLHEREAEVFTQNAARHWQKLVENGLIELASHYTPDIEREIRLLNDHLHQNSLDRPGQMNQVMRSVARRLDRFFANLEKLENGGLIDGAIQLILDTMDDDTIESLLGSMKPDTYQYRQLQDTLNERG